MLQINPTGNLSIIDLATGKETGQIAGGSNGITAAAFSPDARRVTTGTNDGAISIYDGATLQLLRTYAGHKFAVRRLAFSPNGRLLASGSDDGTARIHLADSEIDVATVAADSPVVGVAFSPDGTRLDRDIADGESLHRRYKEWADRSLAKIVRPEEPSMW